MGKTNSDGYHYTKDPTPLTKFLKTMLWILVGIEVFSLIFGLIGLNLLGGLSSIVDLRENVRQIFGVWEILGSLDSIASIVIFITFLMWVYRANLNCHGFGAEEMKFTPGWAVGYFLIPFLNLVRPYQVMKEIWKVSTNPKDWKNVPGSFLLNLWWLLTLIVTFLAFITRNHSVVTIEEMRSLVRLSITTSVIRIPWLIITSLLIGAIFAKQENLVGKGISQ